MLAVLAAVMGVVVGASPLLQVRQMHARGSSADVSIAFLAVIGCGQAIWLGYGLNLGDVPLIMANGLGVAISTITVVVALRLRRRVRIAMVPIPDADGVLTTGARTGESLESPRFELV